MRWQKRSRPPLMYGGGNLVVKALVETPGDVPIVGTGGVGLAARSDAPSLDRLDGRGLGGVLVLGHSESCVSGGICTVTSLIR